MGPRNIGHGSSEHEGTDYLTPCGTVIKGPPPACKHEGGGCGKPKTLKDGTRVSGNCIISFQCPNGIQLRYMHMQNSNYNAANNTMVTGKTGTKGCHLHFEMSIDGVPVDGQCATGAVTPVQDFGASSTKHGVNCPHTGIVNLCDPQVREDLKKQSEQIFGERRQVPDGATAGGGGHNHDHDHGDPHGTDPGQPVVAPIEPDPVDPDPPIEEPQPPPEDNKKDPGNPESPFNPEASKPRCENSTCITNKMIENAKHMRVDDDEVISHLEYILPPGADENSLVTECQKPHKTGVDIHRQVFEGGKGKLKEYVDAFCTNQGCTYVNEEKEGDGECKLPE